MARFHRAAPYSMLLLGLVSLAGCGENFAPLSPETLTEAGPPPNYPLVIPPSIYNALPKNQEMMIEEALREQKRVRLFKTSALLPAMEIVRRRDAEFRDAARVAGLDLRLFQGLIVLECGGREDAIDYMFLRGQGKRAHVGLGQIGSYEARSVGLKVSMGHEMRLKAEIRGAIRLAREHLFGPTEKDPESLTPALQNSARRQMAIIDEWKRVDERFDPRKNLAASARLLRDRMRTYGGDPTLAIASYHAGGGNIGKALRLYRKTKKTSARPTFWHLYSDRSGPVYDLMSGWSDNSRNYFPTVVAAADLVEKYLNLPQQFREEYLYWGPEDAPERLAAVPHLAERL